MSHLPFWRILAVLALGCVMTSDVVACAAASPVAGATVPRGERHAFRREILAVEQQWRAALLRRDTASLGQMLNSTYLGISANGAILTRDDTLAQITSGALSITQLGLSDQKVRVFRQTAVVTSVAELHGIQDHIPLDGRYRYTHVYVRNAQGQWTIVSFEASRIRKWNNLK